MRTIAAAAAGLGLRAEHAARLADGPALPGIDFLEITVENWLEIGGRKRAQLDRIAARYPLVAHGLSLSIGDPLPLNVDFLRRVKRFLDDYRIEVYSDHLSYARDEQGYLYDLLPVRRDAAAARLIAGKVRQAQDILRRPLVLENISYYHAYPDQMPEEEFIAAIVEQSGCELLLDINNVYVNASNHGLDAQAFIRALPSAAIRYFHLAGHWRRDDDLVLDTHGDAVCDGVIRLARDAVARHGPRPFVLERDNHIPPLSELRAEAEALRAAIHGRAALAA